MADSSCGKLSHARLVVRLIFGHHAANRTGGGMRRDMELERELAILMALTEDDREGLPSSAPPREPRSLPPRLRHANDVARRARSR